MSLCGATEKLVELTESLGTTDEIIDKLIDKIPITPAQGQAVADAAAIVAMASDAAAIQSLVTSKLKEFMPEIEIPEEIKGLQSEVEAVVTDILTAKSAAEDIANDVQKLKTKYSGLDLGDLDLQDIPSLLKEGALDLNNLCKKIPNFEENELGEFVLKGTPITTPKKSAVADLLGIQIPEVKDFVFKIETSKQIEEATASFENIKETVESIGL